MAEINLKQLVKGKVYVFIDAANIFYSQRSLGWRISYEKLYKFFQKNITLGKIFVYVGTIPGNEKQKKFLDLLDIVGYIVRTKPIKVITDSSGSKQWKSNFDVELAIEMIDTAGSYDTAILVSGDSDFSPVVDRLKIEGKQVIVVSTKNHISIELLQRAKYIDLKKLREFIELK